MLRKIVFYALLAALFFLLVQAAQATNLETEHELRIIELDIEEEAEQVKKNYQKRGLGNHNRR